MSVCVATRNRTDVMHQLLWSLIRQEYTHWDLVVVDDADTPVRWQNLGVYPELFDEITRTGHDLRLAAGPRVNRMGAAYQVGFRIASKDNPLFLRVSEDSWLEPDYLERLAAVMADERVGACGGLFLHPGREIPTLRPDDVRYRHGFIDNLADHANIQWFFHEIREPIPVEHLTANILFSRKWLELIRGFDERLYQAHRDETQVSWRLAVEGARLYVIPAAVAWCLGGNAGRDRGHAPEVFLEDHRRFMAQRKTMKPGIHLSLGHAIGDGFMATPMIAQMRRMNPDRNLAVYAPWAEAILSGNPDVDDVAAHPLDAQRTARLEESVYAWASSRGWTGHLAEAYCMMFGLPPADDNTPRFFGHGKPEPHSMPEDIRDHPYLVVAPWSTAKTFDLYQDSGNKNWPWDRWLAVTSWAREKGMRVVQLRGSRDEPLVHGVDLDVCGKPLQQALAYVKHASMLVSVDTMAHHAAAAMGIPSVVLWGRSKPDHFGYVKANIINLQGQCPGVTIQIPAPAEDQGGFCLKTVVQDRPCINGDQWAMDREPCPIEGHPCMSAISVESVIEAMEILWRTHGFFVAPRVESPR